VFSRGFGRGITLTRARRGILVEISYGKGRKGAAAFALVPLSRVIHRGRGGSADVLLPLPQNDKGGAKLNAGDNECTFYGAHEVDPLASS